MSNDDATSSSHAMRTYKTMFFKPSMSIHHTHTTRGNKGKRYNSIPPTCHYCGIRGHIHPNCFQLCFQKPWDKEHVPREDELGIKNQVRTLCDQVKLISKKLGSLAPHEKNFVLSKGK
jgi:hypothetical protein